MKTISSLIFLLISSPAFAVDPYVISDSFPKVSGLVLTSTVSEGCSASVIAFEGYNPVDKAYVMTNGHCTGKGDYYGMYPDGDDVFQNAAPDLDAYLYSSGGKDIFQISPEKLVYGTMNTKDIAIYEMPSTYQDLINHGVTPLMVASKPNVQVGSTYSVLSAYWQETVSCEILNNNVPVLQEGPWTWTNAYRMNCKLRGGMSGSPLVDSLNQIVGIVNTGYENGEACTIMNPCEVATDGSNQVYTDAGYAMDISNLYTCLNSERRLDVNVPGCTLPK